MSVDFGDGVVYAVRDVTEERALETLRSDFVATASHELRTPMTSISGAARTLLRHGEQLPPQRHREFLEMIVGESDRLARIVDQIFVASRIEAGKIDVSFERCDATAIARSVVEAAKHRAPTGIELHLDAPGHAGGRLRPGPTSADPRQHRGQRDQVLAGRRRRAHRAARRRRHGPVRCAGRGHGLRASAAEAIFERFHRPTRSKRGGSEEPAWGSTSRASLSGAWRDGSGPSRSAAAARRSRSSYRGCVSSFRPRRASTSGSLDTRSPSSSPFRARA